MRKPPQEFAATLERYDSQLRAEWVPRGARKRVTTECWRIVRLHPDGKPRHLFYVLNDDGSYRPLDNRVMDKLWRCDAARFYNVDQLMEFYDKNPDAQAKGKLEAAEFMERRYHERIAELSERFVGVMHKDADAHTTAEEFQRDLDKRRRRADHAAEVELAYAENRDCTIGLDEDGYPMVLR